MATFPRPPYQGPIPRPHLVHLERAVSIIAGSRDAGLQPHVMRCLGCRVQRQPLRVTVLAARDAAGPVLADVAANDRIAVVFSEPSTHRTVQLKGHEVAVADASPADRALVEDYLVRVIDEICSVGYPRPLVVAMFNHDPQRLVAITFTPTASYDQTPGVRPADPAPVAA